jgi:pimeloyl-ACP methyl ester carboxylesterase
MKHMLRGAGPAILLLHGLPTSGRLWDYIVATMEKNFACVVVDLPGAGESPPFPDGSLDPERYAQELEALREQLEIPCWHVVGHDAGSAIAVHYASRFRGRVQRLVLCSPPIFPEHKIPWFFRLLRTPALGDAIAPLVTAILLPIGLKMSIRRDDPAMPDIIRAFRQPFRGWAGARRFLHILRWGDPAQVLGNTAVLLPGITAPTLVISGTHDGAVPTSFAVRAAEQVPNAQLQLMDCGHFLPLECPEVLCKYLLTFLTREHIPAHIEA